MTKEKFNSLSAMDQINHINTKLLEGNTLTNICKSISVGRSTIRDRFEKVGYKYNSEVKQYQCYIDIVEEQSSNDVVGVCDDEKLLTDDINSNLVHNGVVGANSSYTYEDLINVIQNYENLNNKMNEVYRWYQSENSDDVVDPGKFSIKEFKGDTVARSFKVYDSVQKDFLKFCKKNNKYKVQDILSTLLYEAMQKYK